MAGKKKDPVEKVVVAVEEVEQGERDSGVVTLSTGVQLRVKPMPKHFIFQVTERYKKPKVPLYFDEGKGREEENPEDPDYIEAMQMYLAEISNASTDIAILRGTEVVHIPEDVMGPDSEEFRDELEVLKFGMVDNSRARYLAWIKAIAAPTDADVENLFEEIGRLTGVTEADVAEAADRFQRLEGRESDSDSGGVD
jgi:hypothetical protein